MKITDIEITPLNIPFKQPYFWARGVKQGTNIVLVRVQTDEGITGVGESMAPHAVESVIATLEAARAWRTGVAAKRRPTP